ncbi:MAG: hypothetical protein WCH04_05520 [Gammaproteobacteria bacterium]
MSASKAPAVTPAQGRAGTRPPGWVWKGLGIAAGGLVLLYLFNRPASDGALQSTEIEPPLQFTDFAVTPGSVQPGAVDRALVAAWVQNVTNSLGVAKWVLEIRADGTYIFSSSGQGAAPNHVGNFTAADGKWTLTAQSITWQDEGTYELPNPDTFVMHGKLGTGVWKKHVRAAGK